MLKKISKSVTQGLTIISLALAAGSVTAEELQPQEFNVVGTWGNLSLWKNHESVFWNETLPAVSHGALEANAAPITELGLKGTEVMRLLKMGVYDFAHGLGGYVAKETAVIEGIDLSSVAQDWDTMRTVVNAYRDVMDETFQKTYGAKILALYPFPSSMIYCSEPVNEIGDLQGRKIRVSTATLGDFVEGAGGVSVTIPFAEVVPALEKGVADCAITDVMSAYRAKWNEVVSNAYLLRVGYSITFAAVNLKTWNKLDSDTQTLLTEQFNVFEDSAWKDSIAEDEMGITCLTGNGECSEGEPGQMTAVKPSDEDLAAREAILKDFVLPRWAERCGADCAKQWSETVGKVTGYENLIQ